MSLLRIRKICYASHRRISACARIGRCMGSCGGKLNLHDEEITYDGMAGSGPSVVIRGTLACATCTAEKMSVEAHVPVRGILDENSDVQVGIRLRGLEPTCQG